MRSIVPHTTIIYVRCKYIWKEKKKTFTVKQLILKYTAVFGFFQQLKEIVWWHRIIPKHILFINNQYWHTWNNNTNEFSKLIQYR